MPILHAVVHRLAFARQFREIVEQMLADEQQHAESALAAGGQQFPKPVKRLMTLVSTVMTKSSYKV